MLTQKSEQWSAVSPYLDEALDMTEAELKILFSAIEAQNPVIAGELKDLLAEHRSLSAEGFLEKEIVPLPGGPSLIGQQLGPYKLLSQLGQGGMGNVWLAERSDGRFERRVAVKFLNISLMGRAGEERFKREGRILARLVHPNIARLLDAGVASTGQPYLVLEYAEGEQIERYCDTRKLDVAARIRLFIGVLTAVAHAHANLIVHRDIKPSNVLVGPDGQVKLLDFSIAKLLEREADFGAATLLTVEGARAMTPEYAAPEQLKGQAVTTATDVYALGVLLYVLLTGQHPAGRGPHTPADLVSSIVDKEPARPSEVVSQLAGDGENASENAMNRSTTPEKLCRVLAGDLDTIITQALKKNPAERYSSVLAFADDLRRYLTSQPISARPDALVYRAAKFLRRNRTAVALAALAILAGVAGLVGTLAQNRAARAQRDFALQQMESSEILNEFHEFLLSDAAPSGKPFTVNDLLDRASRIIDRQHAANDPNRLRLMLSIGHQYLEQDEAARARPVLEEVYKLSRQSPDISIRARASCLLGVSVALADELPRGEMLFHQGLSEIPAGPQYALERISCLRSGAEIAVQSGSGAEAVSRAQMEQRVLRDSRFDSESLELGVWIDLATAYSTAGLDDEAVSAFEKASALLSSLGRDQTENAAILFCNWGLELDLLGCPLEAEGKYRRAMEIERTGKTEDVSPMLLTNYARALEELNRLTEAGDYARRAYLRAQRVGYSVPALLSLFESGRVAVAQGEMSRATVIFDQIEPRLRSHFPAEHYGFAILASQRALIELVKGNREKAMSFADQAVFIDEKAIASGGDGAHDLPGLLVVRSTIELAMSHADAAASDARRAVDLVARKMKAGKSSSVLGRAYLALGRALRSQGKVEEARRAFQSAASQLQTSLGGSHPDTRSANRLAGL